MDILSKDELRELMEHRFDACVSLYMPTERLGAETQQNPIRLKNLLSQAEEQLVKSGVRTPQAQKLLKPAVELQQDRPAWQSMGDGLALFIGPDTYYAYRVPLRFDELVVVSDRFHIKPLLPLLSGDGRFYLLALSLGNVRVLQGSQYSANEIVLEDAPDSLAEVLQYDEFEKTLQFHTTTGQRVQRGGGGGDRAAVFHGQGTGTDEAKEKENILRFLRALDDGVRELIGGGEQMPLVLAGVEHLRGLYRDVNHYPYLVGDGIDGNPENMPVSELHEKGWKIVQPIFQQAQDEAAARYQELAGTGSERASNKVDAVVAAAYFERVETLFVDVNRQYWGAFDRESGDVAFHDERHPGDLDLLDYASAHTLTNGGTVYAVESDEMPTDAAVAAVFRY